MKRTASRIHLILSLALMAALSAFVGTAEAAKKNTQKKVVTASATVSREEALRTVLANYRPWTCVEFSGKLRMERLPVSPSVRLYMEKGKCIQISARAPLLGEIARAEISQDSVLLVNKANKTYCRESTSRIMNAYPGFLNDVQSLLLGRVIVAGEGELSNANAPDVEFDTSVASEWLIVPVRQPDFIDAAYGYSIIPNGRTASMMLELPSHDIELDLLYSYRNSGMELEVAFVKGNRQLDATLDFSSVKWGGSKLSPLRLDSKYRRLGIAEFIKMKK